MENEMFTFKKDAEGVAMDDFWYNLTDGGYIRPEKLIDDKDQLEKLNNAIATILTFKDELEEAGLVDFV